MRSESSLFKLIKTLSPAEKKYFRQYAQRHTIGEKNIYLRLFDEINKAGDGKLCDEKKIRQNVQKYSASVNFSEQKNYLYEMILKSMRSYSAVSKVENIINNLLADHQFLAAKSLLHESGEVLRKAKQLAIKYEKFEKLHDIINRERQLKRRNDPSNVELDAPFNLEALRLLKLLENNETFRYLNNRYVAITNKFGITNIETLKSELKEIVECRYLRNENEALSFNSKMFFYQINGGYNFILNEYETALLYFGKLIDHFEQYPHMIHENLQGYLIMLQNCIDISYFIKKDAKAKSYLKKLEKVVNDKSYKVSIVTRVRIIARKAIMELRRYTETGDYDPESHIVRSAIDDHEQFKDLMAPEDRIILIFQFAMFNFGCKNYTASLEWLAQITNKEEDLRSDLRIECKLLFLIIHYELENFDLLEYAVKSAYRYLRKKEHLKGMEPVILSFIKKLSGIAGPTELRKIFVELRDWLIKNEEIASQYAFYYQQWIESKIQNKPFSEVVKAKYSGTEYHLKGS